MEIAFMKRTSKEFNAEPYEKGHKENGEFGISPLHARIRSMEFLLQLAFEKPIGFKIKRKKESSTEWRARPKAERDRIIAEHKTREAERVAKVKIEKERRISEFKKKAGFPRQGFGNTNDGNSSRRFFENVDVTS
ncbi:unnamed protein product [Bemisia tabaci]|uniref:Uncharacterized protein n=1 Tax=Bemisia tabaci TaxID=7038 RepID=A0A9P0A9V6_BEMTA|nr:unnamed protein product [Bemisia tabaci]